MTAPPRGKTIITVPPRGKNTDVTTNTSVSYSYDLTYMHQSK